MQLQKYLDTSDERYLEDGYYFNEADNDFDSQYCQSVLDASSIDENKRYVLSDVNVIKLLHDHGADVNEWQEDCKRYNDPQELLMWLGY